MRMLARVESVLAVLAWTAVAAGGTASARTAGYTYTGDWLGRLVHLTQVSNVSVQAFPDARLTGTLTDFSTDDPRDACLKGHALTVWIAPREFPGDYVVHNGPQGPQCVHGTWAFPEQPRSTGAPPLSGSPGIAADLQWLVTLGIVPSDWTPKSVAAHSVTVRQAVDAIWRLQLRRPTPPRSNAPAQAWAWALAHHVVRHPAAHASTGVVNRATLLAWLARAFHWTGHAALPWLDGRAIPPGDRAGVQAAQAKGVMYPITNGRLEPLAPVTRDQATLVLVQAAQAVVLGHAATAPLRWAGLACPPSAPHCNTLPPMTGRVQTARGVLAGVSASTVVGTLGGRLTLQAHGQAVPVRLGWTSRLLTVGGLTLLSTRTTVIVSAHASETATSLVTHATGPNGTMTGTETTGPASGPSAGVQTATVTFQRHPDGVESSTWVRRGTRESGTVSGAFRPIVRGATETTEFCNNSALASCERRLGTLTGPKLPVPMLTVLESYLQGLLFLAAF